jgi:mannitol 2-dehydrogenase
MTNTTSTVPVSAAALKNPPQNVDAGHYDRTAIKQGIVHLGVGAFHRSHQALYIDELLASHGVEDWAICGVGIMPQDATMNKAMTAQDCVYTLVEKSGDVSRARLIGSITEYIFGYENPEAVFNKMQQPSIRIVSMTATEGGYCFSAETGELDFEHPAIKNDLQNPLRPQTIFGYLAEGLARRRQAGMPPFTVLSCDNLQGNGHVTRRTLLAFCRRRDPQLAEWVEKNVSFPNCMVDRITPATTDAERQFVADAYGLQDACPVVAEPFRQWVIEDEFSAGRPPLEKVGVQFTGDVAPYEKMKIRLLNATHSAMGYLGYLSGYRYIYEIARAPEFQPYLQELMDVEVTPLVGTVPGVDLSAYKRSLMERFANETIKDQALRICMDGSGKMPKFILPSIQEQLAAGGPIRRLTLCVASWIRFLNGIDEQGQEIPIVDPQAQRLKAAATAGKKDPAAMLALTDIFADLGKNEHFVAELRLLLTMLYDQGARATLDYVVKNPQ